MNETVQPGTPEDDERMMRRAIGLATRGAGWTNPNPLVGAVVVKDGRVIGEGFHERYGQQHAERNALDDCARRGEDPRGATLYVTLEPCCHHGKQPPCTQAVIEAGIARVVVGSRDPNPLVAGKGNGQLRVAGIQVDADVAREECDALNPVFFHYIQGKRPYVVAKWAMTLDGKTATRTGDSRWVSGEQSRADVHELRHRLAAIMVGIGTALADDPSLTARRSVPSNQPLRIVVDGKQRIPLNSRLVQTAREVPVLVACALPEDAPQALALRERGVEVLSLPGADGRVDLAALMDALGARGVDSVLVEGGGTLHAALFEANFVDRAIVYLAPKVCGGTDAKTPVEGAGAELMANAVELGAPQVEHMGGDLKLTYLHAGEQEFGDLVPDTGELAPGSLGAEPDTEPGAGAGITAAQDGVGIEPDSNANAAEPQGEHAGASSAAGVPVPCESATDPRTDTTPPQESGGSQGGESPCSRE